MEAPCAIKNVILQSPPGQPLPAPLARHATACPTCAEALWMQTLTAEGAAPDVTPAGLVYWRAELRLRNERLDTALRPTRLLQAALPMVLAGLGAATAWQAGQPAVLIAAILFALLSAASLYITRSA